MYDTFTMYTTSRVSDTPVTTDVSTRQVTACWHGGPSLRWSSRRSLTTLVPGSPTTRSTRRCRHNRCGRASTARRCCSRAWGGWRCLTRATCSSSRRRTPAPRRRPTTPRSTSHLTTTSSSTCLTTTQTLARNWWEAQWHFLFLFGFILFYFIWEGKKMWIVRIFLILNFSCNLKI